MNVDAYLNSILPRSDSALETGSAWLRGRETKENFYNVLEKETAGLIELQQDFGMAYILDGQLFWGDFLRPIADALKLHRKGGSADENPVTRQIYTNTFYRKPLILNRLSNFDKDILDTRFMNLIPKGKRKVVLPSPFALVYLSDGIHRNESGKIKNEVFTELLLDAAKALNQEARRLEKDSCVSFIQFNEPCLPYADEAKFFWSNICDSLKIAVKGLKITTSLHLYNGDASRFLPELLELPVSRIGIDFYATNIRKFAGINFEKFLEAGIVNSKNSLVEEPEVIAKYARQVQEKINPEGLALVPNRPLELVPRKIALKKIESLAKAADLLNSK